jgi:signal peptidase I
MDQATHDQAGRRSFAARVGITALNLIVPGLGLLRLGDWRAGILFVLAVFAWMALLTFGLGHLPITNYARALLGIVAVLGLAVVFYAAVAVLTWRKSRFRAPARGWSRWYGVTAIAIVLSVLFQLTAPLIQRFYKGFYLPSDSMAPTAGMGDRFIADMRWRGPIARGEIIVFNGPDSVRISRIAAVAGDRIAMRDGVPIINGEPAIQRSKGETIFTGYDGPQGAAMLEERLPGEASAHRILDTGSSEFDGMPERVVPANHVFVLGDNRDRAADSRVPHGLGGVEMVPVTALIGRPMYIHWSEDRAKIGTRLDR